MLIFRENGRLGNQIFQYAALRTLCREKEKLVLLGFEELQATFNGIDAQIINSRSSRIERYFYYRLFSFMSQNVLFTRIQESENSAHPTIKQHSGLVENMKIIEESFFQSETLFSTDVIDSLAIDRKLLKRASCLLREVVQAAVPIFVHIRRGDYVTWPDRNNPAILSSEYYRRCIDIVRTKIPNAFFIFTSDDRFYLEEVFGDTENSYISQGNSSEDFALMTLCHGGILSASSFSWWAAYLSSRKIEKSIFLAPKYWAGHRRKSWKPKFIQSGFLEYVDAEAVNQQTLSLHKFPEIKR